MFILIVFINSEQILLQQFPHWFFSSALIKIFIGYIFLYKELRFLYNLCLYLWIKIKKLDISRYLHYFISNGGKFHPKWIHRSICPMWFFAIISVEELYDWWINPISCWSTVVMRGQLLFKSFHLFQKNMYHMTISGFFNFIRENYLKMILWMISLTMIDIFRLIDHSFSAKRSNSAETNLKDENDLLIKITRVQIYYVIYQRN